jgi:hypothetical protein
LKSIPMISHRLLLVYLAVFGNKLMDVIAFSLSQSKAISRDGNYGTTLKLPLVTDQGSTLRPKASATFPLTKLHATSKRSSPPPKKADFEYQELQIQMQAMQKQDVKPSQLTADKRVELEGYVKRILEQRESILPLNRLGDVLPQTKWRMAFSTEPIMSEVLPKDATITLNFLDEKSVEYSLNFSKTLGLKRLTAKSSYTVDVSEVKRTVERNIMSSAVNGG